MLLQAFYLSSCPGQPAAFQRLLTLKMRRDAAVIWVENLRQDALSDRVSQLSSIALWVVLMSLSVG